MMNLTLAKYTPSPAGAAGTAGRPAPRIQHLAAAHLLSVRHQMSRRLSGRRATTLPPPT